MIDLGKTMLNIVFLTCAGKDMIKGMPVAFSVGELNAILCEKSVDFIRNGLDKPVQDRVTLTMVKLNSLKPAGQRCSRLVPCPPV